MKKLLSRLSAIGLLGTLGCFHMPVCQAFEEHPEVTLLVLPRPVSLMCTIEISVPSGSAYDGMERCGLAHVTEHVMFDGSTHLGPGELVHWTNVVGGDAQASTGDYRTVFVDVVPAVDVRLMMYMEGLRFTKLDSSSSALLTELKVVKNEIKHRLPSRLELLRRDNIGALENRSAACRAVGDEEALSHITRDDVLANFEKRYRRKITIVASGSCSEKRMLSYVRTAFPQSRILTQIKEKAVNTSSNHSGGHVTVSKGTVSIMLAVGPENTKSFYCAAIAREIIRAWRADQTRCSGCESVDMLITPSFDTAFASFDLSLQEVNEVASPQLVAARLLNELRSFATPVVVETAANRVRNQVQQEWQNDASRAELISRFSLLYQKGYDPRIASRVLRGIKADDIEKFLGEYAYLAASNR